MHIVGLRNRLQIFALPLIGSPHSFPLRIAEDMSQPCLDWVRRENDRKSAAYGCHSTLKDDQMAPFLLKNTSKCFILVLLYSIVQNSHGDENAFAEKLRTFFLDPLPKNVTEEDCHNLRQRIEEFENKTFKNVSHPQLQKHIMPLRGKMMWLRDPLKFNMYFSCAVASDEVRQTLKYL